MDTLTVRVEASASAAGDEARAASGRELAGYVKGVVGVTAKVDVVAPGGVERSMGKAVRVVDERG
jgi:phenylacetate-CoA ligase